MLDSQIQNKIHSLLHNEHNDNFFYGGMFKYKKSKYLRLARFLPMRYKLMDLFLK